VTSSTLYNDLMDAGESLRTLRDSFKSVIKRTAKVIKKNSQHP
jgi:hypothetical protein